MVGVYLPAKVGIGGTFTYFGSNITELLEQSGKTALVALLSLAIAIVIGLPIGAWVGHLHKFSFIAINGGNALRALPTLSIIAIGVSLYGLGLLNITVALVILGLPLILTNAYVAVDGVDPGMVKAARGMGMTGAQILFRIELPSSVPLIMAGIRTAWVYVLATAYLATFASVAGTLGDTIASIGSFGLGGVCAAAICAIIMALLGELILAGVESWLDPRGMKIIRKTPAGA